MTFKCCGFFSVAYLLVFLDLFIFFFKICMYIIEVIEGLKGSNVICCSL